MVSMNKIATNEKQFCKVPWQLSAIGEIYYGVGE